MVDEHRTADGIAVYPGAGHVHLMMSAAELLDRPTALTDVALLTPLVVLVSEQRLQRQLRKSRKSRLPLFQLGLRFAVAFAKS